MSARVTKGGGLRTVAGALALISGAIGSPLAAQSAASDYTSATRYDAAGRVTGTISADPDGSGSLEHLATRTTYNDLGHAIKVENGTLSTWKSENVAPKDWGSAFKAYTTIETEYDLLGRKLVERTLGENLAIVSVTQYSYDSAGRLECTAVRMNPVDWHIPLPDVCAYNAGSSVNPDRITKTIYAGSTLVAQVRRAVGTPLEQAEVTYDYTANKQRKSLIDANGNRTDYTYDGYDRLERWNFPSRAQPLAFDDATPTSALASAGASDPDDYEEYGYDANDNRISLRKRDGYTISYVYDALDRMTKKDLPLNYSVLQSQRRDVFYEYDLRGLQTAARFDSATGSGIFSEYDGFGRLVATTDAVDGRNYTVSYVYDANGNRIWTTYPDGARFGYGWDGLDRIEYVRNGTANYNWISNFTFDLPGRLNFVGRKDDAIDIRYFHDTAGRLNQLMLDDVAVSSKVSWAFTRNPAGQIASETRDNPDYAFTDHANLTRGYAVNGLNQYAAVGASGYCHDANGNLTADGQHVYRYDVENRLYEMRVQTNTDCANLDLSGQWRAGLFYDPLGRLSRINFGSLEDTHFVYDGDALIAEYDDDTGAMLRRYVHGPNAGADDPLIWYEGAGYDWPDVRFLYPDARGSVVLVADKDGNRIALNTYDEYGIPGANNEGRFQYTGQIWLPRLGMYYYKARMYSPTLGRFMQTDPIGYEDQFNLYAYVGNDPINGIDYTGQETELLDEQRVSALDENGNSNKEALLEKFAELSEEIKAKTEASDFSREYALTVTFDKESGDLVFGVHEGPKKGLFSGGSVNPLPYLRSLGDSHRLVYAAHTHTGVGVAKGMGGPVATYDALRIGRSVNRSGPSPDDTALAASIRTSRPNARFGVFYQDMTASKKASKWKYRSF